MTVEAFFGSLVPFVLARREWLRHTIREGTVGKGGVFLFLFGAYGLPISTVLGCVKSRARAGVAKGYHGAQTSCRIHIRRLPKKTKHTITPESVRSPCTKGREGRRVDSVGERTYVFRACAAISRAA